MARKSKATKEAGLQLPYGQKPNPKPRRVPDATKKVMREQFDTLPEEFQDELDAYLYEYKSTEIDDTKKEKTELVNPPPWREGISFLPDDLRCLIEKHELTDGIREYDVEPGEFRSVTQNTVNAYIDRICHYKNTSAIELSEQRLAEQNEQDEKSAANEGETSGRSGRQLKRATGRRKQNFSRSRSPEKTPKNKGYRIRDYKKAVDGQGEIDITSPGKDVSCAFLTCQAWDNVCFEDGPHGPSRDKKQTPHHLHIELEKMDCLGSNFQNLDYLFLPCYVPDPPLVYADDPVPTPKHTDSPDGDDDDEEEEVGRHEHFFLTGIAPKQKFVFVIDGYDNRHPDDQPHYDLNFGWVEPIIETLIEEYGGNYGTVEMDWACYGQYNYRGKTVDGSPNSPQQKDAYNCGVFTMTNALCLAFGYDLTCWNQKDLDHGKRPRIAAELLHGGFIDPFNYKLMQIPWQTVPNAYPGHENSQREELERTVLERAALEDEDTDMMDVDGAITFAPKHRIVKPALKKQKLDSNFMLFGGCQKEIFLYAVKEPMFAKFEDRKHLVEACKQLDIKNYTRWEGKSLKVFRGWMENVMAGRMAKEEGSSEAFDWEFVQSKPKKGEKIEEVTETEPVTSPKKASPSKKISPSKIVGPSKQGTKAKANKTTTGIADLIKTVRINLITLIEQKKKTTEERKVTEPARRSARIAFTQGLGKIPGEVGSRAGRVESFWSR